MILLLSKLTYIFLNRSAAHKSGAAEAGDVAENQALKLSAVDDDIMIEFQAFSVISAVVPTTTGKNNSRGNNL